MPAKARSQDPSPPQPRPALLHRAAPTALLVGLAFVVYAPALSAGFIWDDGRAITNNAAFQTPGGFWDIWAGRGDADYFPLKTSILWLLYQLFGPATAPYHVFNVAIHAANAVLLWRVLGRMAIPGAWLAGLVFLVHPTHVESVAWVSECKNTLSTLFGLLSVLCWFDYRRDRRVRSYLGALALFVCALLCKGHLVILPLVLLLCSWWQRGAAAATDAGPRRTPRPASTRHMLAFFLIAVLFAGITLWFQNTRAIADYQLPVGGIASRIANAGKATWWYLGKAISPVHLWYEMPDRPIESETEALAVLAGTRSANPAPPWPRGKLVAWPLIIIYPRWRVTPPVWYDFMPAVAMLGLFAWSARKRQGRGRGVFFAFAYFLVALLPVLGLVKMSYMRAAWVADHFQYLADIGVIALGAAGGTLLWRRVSQAWRRLLVTAAATLLGGCAVCTFARAADYRSEYALWSDTVSKNPDAWQAQGRLGAALLARNDARAAALHFAQSVRLQPDDPDGRNNLGLALVSSGRVEEGIEQYRASLGLKPAQFFAHANLADALAGQKRYAAAAAEYRAALRFQPSLAPLHYRLGVALLEAGKIDEAIASLERADALAPRNSEVAAALAKARGRREPSR
jgi:protein O-mannosyl-transferase